jgi:sigma-B regulation protein RsbU (phosphoserine phosphatase)
MTTVPVPRQPSQPSDRNRQEAASEITPVLALKELVARLHREQTKIQDLLSSLSFALRSFSNLNQFLELIALIASRVTDSEVTALVLFKPNGQVRLEHLHCHDAHQCQEVRQALEIATHQLTLSLPGTKLLRDSLALDKQVSHYLKPGIQWFSTAILVKNVERGRLYFFSRDPEYTWTDTRQQLAQLVADQTAVAIENDELAVELRKKQRLDRELEIGAEIQLRLLPRQCPQIQGVELAARCQTADRVGGDYYDFIPINYGLPAQETEAASTHCWGLAIGDVMGKGVPAGLIMTMTRGMLRAELLNGHSPARILQHLNHVMYADLENSNRFVTLFYSQYDPQTQILSYSNAAHNPPFLWRAATDSVKQLDTLGMLIGLDAETQYQEAQVQLQPGDTIIYYTDGFTDAANQSGDRFDEENLLRAFLWACHNCKGPQAILDYLFNQVQQFIGPQNQNADDMALIVLQVNQF